MSGAPAEVGSTANNYQILARLATGGMAEIFLARGVSAAGVERYCVLKRILRNRASDVHFVRMFLDEARLAAQLNHANVAQVYDIGKLGDSYFFTMEYVHGETVRALLQRARSLRRELPPAAILTVIGGAAAGLHHAHERLGLEGRPLGIVHRDVSPSNLMVSFEGGVKLVDFGVAKAANRMQETRSGTVKGKISYLSPEQCRGQPVDRRSDLFALGIVMWEMLTTERLYRRASDFENMTAIVNEPVPPPSARRPGVPPELDAIALRLLAKDPAGRYQTADEVVEALEAASAKLGAMISSSALGRLLREMFGLRPEPWLELDPETVPVEGVTVTSEPIPAELGLPVTDDLDLQLSDVPDLSHERSRSNADAIPRPAQPPPTAQLRVPARAPVVSARPAAAAELPLPAPPPSGKHVVPVAPLPVTPRPSAPPAGGPALPVTPRPSAPPLPGLPVTPRPSAPTLSGPGLPVTPRPSAQPSSAVPSSGAHAVPSSGAHAQSSSGAHALPSSGAHALPSSGVYPTALPPLPERAPERPARSWPMIAVIGAAAVVGSLTVWIAMKAGGGRSKPPAEVPASATSSEPTNPVAPGSAVAPARGEPVVQPPSGEAKGSAEPVARDPSSTSDVAKGSAEPAVKGSAEPAVKGSAEPAAKGSAEPVAKGSAGSPAAGSAASTAPPLDDPAAPGVPPVAAAEPDKSPLQLAIDEQRYADAVAICKRKITADTAFACTLAACHVSLDPLARSWFARIKREGRASIQSTCRDLGVDVSPRARARPTDAGVDPCELDPRTCQH